MVAKAAELTPRRLLGSGLDSLHFGHATSQYPNPSFSVVADPRRRATIQDLTPASFVTDGNSVMRRFVQP